MVDKEEKGTPLGGDDTPPVDVSVDDDIKDSFLKGDDKDMHRMASQIGRVHKGLEGQEKINQQLLQGLQAVTEALQGLRSNPSVQNSAPSGSALAELNERIKNSLFDNPVEAFDIYYETRRQAEDSISQNRKTQVENLIGRIKGPYLDHIKDKVQEMAYKYVAQGKDPQTAVELAYAQNRAAFSDSLIATLGEQNPGALEMLGDKGKGRGGTPPPKKWPVELEKAWARDSQLKKGDGSPMFKDKSAYMKAMSPAVREHYELG